MSRKFGGRGASVSSTSRSADVVVHSCGPSRGWGSNRVPALSSGSSPLTTLGHSQTQSVTSSSASSSTSLHSLAKSSTNTTSSPTPSPSSSSTSPSSHTVSTSTSVSPSSAFTSTASSPSCVGLTNAPPAALSSSDLTEMDNTFSVAPVQADHYARTQDPTRVELQTRLSALYSTPSLPLQCCILPSGMQAIFTVFQSELTQQLKRGGNVVFVVGSELYCDTFRVLDYLVTIFTPRFSYVRVPIFSNEVIHACFRTHQARIGLFFLECCSNPSGHMFDFSQLTQLRSLAPHCRVVVDNTWLSASLFNPFVRDNSLARTRGRVSDVDLVVLSLTKYYSGARCIGGAVLGPRSAIQPTLELIKVSGAHVSPFNCRQVLMGVASLAPRMRIGAELSLKAAEFLEQHRCVNRVMYPLLTSHPVYACNARYLTNGGPSVIWFHVCLPKQAVSSWVRSSSFFRYETSYGDRYCKVDCWPQEGWSNMYDDRKTEGQQGTWVRLSIGWEVAPEVLINELDKLLRALPPLPLAGRGSQMPEPNK